MWTFTRLPTSTSAADAAAAAAAPAAAVVDAHDAEALAALHEDPANWSEARLCSRDEGFYFSKRDPRVCVRKRNRALSWTVNLGHPRALAVVLAFIIGVGIVPAVVNALVLARLKRC